MGCKVDLLVLLSHLGPDDDSAVAADVTDDQAQMTRDDPNAAALGDVQGIDVVLGCLLYTSRCV